MTLSAATRKAVETSGMTRYAISKETGINESTLSRFVASGKGLSMPNADILCQFLGLELTKNAGAARKGK